MMRARTKHAKIFLEDEEVTGMHISLSQLLENTAKAQVEQLHGIIKGKKKRFLIARYTKQLKRRMDDSPELKQCILDQCKYGRERAIRLMILRRKFEGII